MILYTCQCGKAEYYASGMMPQSCEGCAECGTNFNKEPLQPHDWRPQFNHDTGKPDRPVCNRCYTRQRDWVPPNA